MTREEVYDKCTEKIGQPNLNSFRKVNGKNVFEMVNSDETIWVVRPLLPKESIDAIIDCAVEEAVERIKNMDFATIGGRT